MPEARTVRPPATGFVRGTWREQPGYQSVEIRVNPQANRETSEFRLAFSRRWGYQIDDVSDMTMAMSRAGAIELRDALTAAIGWTPKEEVSE